MDASVTGFKLRFALAAALLLLAIPVTTGARASTLTSLGNSILALDMVNGKVGWAQTTWGVIKTTDGGLLWRSVGPSQYTAKRGNICSKRGSVESGAVRLFVVDRRTASLAVHCDGPNGDSKLMTIWKTTSGGAHWRATLLSNEKFVMAHDLFFQFIKGGRLGWLAPESRDAGFPEIESFFETSDTGTHWRQVELPQDSSGAPVADLIGFSPLQVGYGYSGTQRGQFSDTYTDFSHFPEVDRHENLLWQLIRVPIPPGFHKALLTIGGVGFSSTGSVAIPVAGWIGTNPLNPRASFCATYHANADGLNWKYQLAPGKICPAEYLNTRVGWGTAAVGHGEELYRTTDGGRYWKLRGPLLQPEPIPGTFVTKAIGYTLASNGTIHITRNGGATWNSLVPKLRTKS